MTDDHVYYTMPYGGITSQDFWLGQAPNVASNRLLTLNLTERMDVLIDTRLLFAQEAIRIADTINVFSGYVSAVGVGLEQISSDVIISLVNLRKRCICDFTVYVWMPGFTAPTTNFLITDGSDPFAIQEQILEMKVANDI